MPNRVGILGDEVKRLRTEPPVSMSRRELADRVGVTESHIEHIETGRTTRIFPVVVESLARVLGVGPNEIAPDYQPPMNKLLGRVAYDRARLNQIFYRSGYTQKEWAERAGFDPSTASSLLNREHASADVETLYKAAKGLGVPVGQISQPLSVPPSKYEREQFEHFGMPLVDYPDIPKSATEDDIED